MISDFAALVLIGTALIIGFMFGWFALYMLGRNTEAINWRQIYMDLGKMDATINYIHIKNEIRDDILRELKK
jgi:hypothetical protein